MIKDSKIIENKENVSEIKQTVYGLKYNARQQKRKSDNSDNCDCSICIGLRGTK